MDEGKMSHLISWEAVGKLVNRGGLELGNIKVRNKALLAKRCWQPPFNMIFYGIGLLRVIMALTPFNGCQVGLKSHFGICGRIFLLSSLPFHWAVGDGKDTYFWKDQ